jgi:CrcB protein
VLGTSDVDRREMAAIFAGGAIGALARAGISQLFPSGPESWPWAVFVINLSGAFILGYAITQIERRPPPSSYWRPLIGSGFCGTFTTFSTLQLELLNMVRYEDYWLAAAYAGASIGLGYLAVSTATALVRRHRMFR